MNSNEMEHNVTGALHSLSKLKKMRKASDEFPPDIKGNAHKLEKFRGVMTQEADSIGVVPLPLSNKGILKKAFNKLLGRQPEIFLDKLGERLAFERSGVRLYEAAIAKAKGLGESKKILSQLKHIHDEEAKHMHLVALAIEHLQADATAMTPGADLSGVIGLGLMQVVSDPRTNMCQALEALLNAELIDNAGWELLIQLAYAHGQEKLASEFEKALVQEEDHLCIIRLLLKERYEID